MDIYENTNLQEDYVSFETAKLLKEKGFDEICETAYETITNAHEVEQCSISSWGKLGQVKRPTLQMVMKWMRKWHNLHCDVGYDFKLGWHIQITSLKEVVQDHYTEMKTYLPNKAVNYPSYEEACEAAIKYCLEKLI